MDGIINKLAAFVLILFSLPFAYAQEVSLSDISSIKFNSLSVGNSGGQNQLTFNVSAQKASRFEGLIDIKKSTQKSIEYFFTALALPDDKFWVNLNPAGEAQIIDPGLAGTDFGRVMLKADLRLKQDFSELVNPESSPIGREFWRRLYEKAGQLGIGDKLETNTRLWIIPEEVTAYEADNRVSLGESKLKVCLESEYLNQNIELKDQRQKEFQDYASGLMREMILPFLNLKANENYSYSDLRDVYQALLLARWYKDKFGAQPKAILNAAILKDAPTDLPYTASQVYQDYLASLKKGEYSSKETISQGLGPYKTTKLRQYVSGGIDCTRTRMKVIKGKIPPKRRENEAWFSCSFFLPSDIERPLNYAKTNYELTAGDVEYPRYPQRLLEQPPSGSAQKRLMALVNEGLPEMTGFPVLFDKVEGLNFSHQKVFLNKL